jgi:hypothetical protein
MITEDDWPNIKPGDIFEYLPDGRKFIISNIEVQADNQLVRLSYFQLVDTTLFNSLGARYVDYVLNNTEIFKTIRDSSYRFLEQWSIIWSEPEEPPYIKVSAIISREERFKYDL